MIEPLYNILWIDDEHEELVSLKRAAIDFDLKLHPFKSLESGIAELEGNQKSYDGVLLDAKFYASENDVAGTEDTANSIAAKERVDQLDKRFEIHVLTGQAEAFGDKMYNKFFKKVFRKGISEDEEKLFQSLRKSASRQIDNQIMHQFKDVFNICDSKYLGREIEAKLLDIARPLQKETVDSFNTEHLTTMRKVVERLIMRLSELNLIPLEIAENKGWINGASRYISNIHDDFKQIEEYFHPFIAYTFHRLLFVLQDSSHGEGVLRLRVDSYLKGSKNLYIVKSCAYQLFEILVWSKSLIDKYPNEDSNKSLWEVINNCKIIGVIDIDSQGNFYCGPHILDYRYTKENYKVGDEIVITELKDNISERTKIMYPMRVQRYKSNKTA